MSAYSPYSVPLAGLTEAVAAGVNLSLDEQTLAGSDGTDIGATMGMFPTYPGDGTNP